MAPVWTDITADITLILTGYQADHLIDYHAVLRIAQSQMAHIADLLEDAVTLHASEQIENGGTLSFLNVKHADSQLSIGDPHQPVMDLSMGEYFHKLKETLFG